MELNAFEKSSHKDDSFFFVLAFAITLYLDVLSWGSYLIR